MQVKNFSRQLLEIVFLFFMQVVSNAVNLNEMSSCFLRKIRMFFPELAQSLFDFGDSVLIFKVSIGQIVSVFSPLSI